MPVTPDAIVDDYLRRLDRALGSAPHETRAGVVAELAAHIADRRAAGAPAALVLAELGEPRRLARAYREAQGAGASSGRAMATAALVASTRGAGRALRMLATGLFGVVALTCFAVAAAKPLLPAHTGLWLTPHGMAVGVLSAPGPAAQERLGWSLIPLMLALALLCATAAYRLARAHGEGAESGWAHTA